MNIRRYDPVEIGKNHRTLLIWDRRGTGCVDAH